MMRRWMRTAETIMTRTMMFLFEVDPVDDDLEVDPVEADLSLVEKEAACRFMEKGSRDAFERGKLMRCARTWEKTRSKWKSSR